MTPMPCPSCSTPILSAPSLGGVEIVLQLADPKRDPKSAATICIRGGLALVVTTPEVGETKYVAHRPRCGRAAA